MHIVFYLFHQCLFIYSYIFSINVYSLLKVEERDFHICKIEDCNQFVANPPIALKQLTLNLHLTINEKFIYWKSQKHGPRIKSKFDTKICMHETRCGVHKLLFFHSYVGCS
jgi:hypothetical protein